MDPDRIRIYTNWKGVKIIANKWKYQILEYKVKGGIAREMNVEGDYLKDLNAAGWEGWELVGIIPFTENQGRLSRVHLVLKKPE